MLGKLLKYEFKSAARIFLPLYASLILFAVISNIFFRIKKNELFMNIISFTNIISVISTSAYVFIIIAIFVLTLLVMIQRFYKNLLGDEGYLMFTLPVKTREHIASKLLTSMMWIITSTIITIVSVIIISYNENTFASLKNVISQMFSEIKRVFGINGYAYLIEFLIFLLMVLATNILMIYASIAVGQLVSKHKVLGAFGAYLGFYMLSQIIISIIFISYYSISSRSLNSFETIINNIAQSNTIPHFVFVGIMLLNLFFAGAYYIITDLILSKKLNLE